MDMPTCGTLIFNIATIFIIGLIIGAVIVLALKLKGISFKRKYGFKDTEMPSLKEMNPADESVLYNEKKDTVDGSAALKEFNRK
jgi:hypothetical protein